MGHNTKQERILLKRNAALGDVLLATATLPALAKRFPSHKIDFETSCESIVKNNGFIDRIFSPGTTRPSDYSHIFDLNNTYEMQPGESIIGAFAKATNCTQDEMRLFYRPSDKEIAIADTILLQRGLVGKELIAIQSGTSFWLRSMDPGFIERVVLSFKEIPHLRFIHLGSANDPLISGAIDFRGKYEISQSVALLHRCKGFIGPDSALVHFAKAMSIPVATFFGSIDPSKRIAASKNDCLFISELPCRFCYHRQKPPVIIPFCEKQVFYWRFLDQVIQFSLKHSLIKRNKIASYVVGLLYAEQNRLRNGRKIAKCMKYIESQQVIQRITAWLQDLELIHK